MAGLSTGSGLVQASAGGGGYTRPSDWPAVPAPGTDGINLLTAVFANGGNNVAFNITVVGGYTVDWGDGTVNNWASGVQAEHTYTYSALVSAVTSRGYKTSIIKIYAQTPGSAITAFNFGIKSSVFGTQSCGAMQWLDITVNTPSATSIVFSDANRTSSFLEITTILACGNVASLNYSWQQCFNLQVCSLPANFGSLTTSMIATWYRCESLVNLALPVGFGAASLRFDSLFAGCASIRNITFPAGFGGSATIMNSMFSSNTSLEYVSFPAGFGAACTTIDSMFFSCDCLLSIVFPTGFAPALTTISNAFNSCVSLESVTFNSLIGPTITAAATPFANCFNLESITGLAIPITFSVGGCKFSATALNALYTALPTVTLQTLTASTNYGYAASTPTIATAKGWTVA